MLNKERHLLKNNREKILETETQKAKTGMSSAKRSQFREETWRRPDELTWCERAE